MKFTLAWLALALAPVYSFAQNSEEPPSPIVDGTDCRGNVITSCDFIRDRLHVVAGSRLNEEEIDSAKLRLSSLPNFTHVGIFLERGTERGHVRVIVEIQEADPLTMEAVLGTTAREKNISQFAAARISDQNLFGRGKILDFVASGRAQLAGITGDGYFLRLQYVDPRLLDSSKYFLATGFSYLNASRDYETGEVHQNRHFGADFAIGRRLFDFSYITVGYENLPFSTAKNRTLENDGRFELDNDAARSILFFTYGWNSEDDPYFPTRGSRFSFYNGWDPERKLNFASVGYRHNWKTSGNSIWTLQFGAAPGTESRAQLDNDFDLGVIFARPIGASDGFAGIRRGRWYVEPGVGPAGYTATNGIRIWDAGIKAGIRLETKTFGMVDLYVVATKTWDISL